MGQVYITFELPNVVRIAVQKVQTRVVGKLTGNVPCRGSGSTVTVKL